MAIKACDKLPISSAVLIPGSKSKFPSARPATGLDPVGTGVLRRELPLWLNRPDIRPLILAAAHPHAANPGSVRLLLRRAR